MVGWLPSVGGRQAGSAPCRVAAGDVRGVAQAQILKRGRGQAAAVAVLAENDHLEVEVVGESEPEVAAGVQAPLEDVALDDDRAGDLAVLGTLRLGPDVDQYRAPGGRSGRRPRLESAQAAPGG